jgi:hypothetical protein
MTTPKAKLTFKSAALMGAFSLIIATASQAAFVALPSPADPPVALGGLTLTGGGTVLATLSTPYTAPFSNGTLNTYVVDRGGGLLDFYYQVVNLTPAPDLFGDDQVARIAIENSFNYPGVDPVFAAQTDVDPVTGLPVGGLKPASVADRDRPTGNPLTLGSIGFNFPVAPPNDPAFTSDPLNIASGQSSTFMVVRTNSTVFGAATASVGTNGGFTQVGTFAPIPEPSSILFGIAMFGVALTNRSRRAALKVA